MTPRTRSSWLALAAFLTGGWLANALHGPALHGLAHAHETSAASGHSRSVHSSCGHHHAGSADEAPAAPQEDHDCPVCDHLTMPAVAAAVVDLPAVCEVPCEAVLPAAATPELAFIRTRFSRGPPATAV